MTGPRPRSGRPPAGLLTLLFLAGPAQAQMPDQRPDLPPAPVAPAPAVAPAPGESARPALPSLDVTFQHASGPPTDARIVLPRVVYGNELTVDADEAWGDIAGGEYTLDGHVRAHEADTTLRAARLAFTRRAGPPPASNTPGLLADKALATRGVFSLRADTLAAAPARLTADGVLLTTVPNGGRADASVRAQRLTLDRVKKRGTLYNASLYLFGTRLLTVPRVSFHAGTGGGETRRRLSLPTVGVSARYGTFLAYGSSTRIGPVPFQYRLLLPQRQTLQAVLAGQQTLYAPRPAQPAPGPPPARPATLLDSLRVFATAPTPPLPAGDPLLFHDFLPEPNPIFLFDTPGRGGLGLSEEASLHVAARGRRRDDLYVSRLPEVALRGQLPLSRPPARPAPGDPAAFRNALRHLVFYLDAQETVGQYREQLAAAPYSIRARRVQSQVGLSLFPLLVAPNTVLLPRVSVSSSGYSGQKSAYRYSQASVTLNHYFSDLTAVGVQFQASTTSGDSPFNFDVLDTTRELDLRAQMGTSRLVVAGRVRYDLVKSGVIDYQLALAPALRGLTPVFTYNFRTRSLGLGVEVKGVTF